MTNDSEYEKDQNNFSKKPDRQAGTPETDAAGPRTEQNQLYKRSRGHSPDPWHGSQSEPPGEG